MNPKTLDAWKKYVKQKTPKVDPDAISIKAYAELGDGMDVRTAARHLKKMVERGEAEECLTRDGSRVVRGYRLK